VKETSLVGLREAVRGGRRGLNPLDALDELIDREPRGLTSFLTGVALDTEAGLDVRLSAVGALGIPDSPAATEGLVAALRTADQPIVRRAAQRLGTVGGPAQLEELKMIRTGNKATQDAVRFAKELISYRRRLGEYKVSVSARRVQADPDASEEVPATALSRATRAGLAERVTKPVLGVQLTMEGARELVCRGNPLAILANADLAENGPGWLLGGQAAAAAVVERNPETGRYFASHVVLTDPRRGSDLTVHVARSSGIVVLTGTGNIREDGLVFELAAVPTPHLPPTTIVGAYDRAGGLRFDTVRIDRRMRPAQLRMVKTPRRQTSPTG